MGANCVLGLWKGRSLLFRFNFNYIFLIEITNTLLGCIARRALLLACPITPDRAPLIWQDYAVLEVGPGWPFYLTRCIDTSNGNGTFFFFSTKWKLCSMTRVNMKILSISSTLSYIIYIHKSWLGSVPFPFLDTFWRRQIPSFQTQPPRKLTIIIDLLN